MPLHVRDGGTWRQVNALYVRGGGSWKPVSAAWVRDNGTWVPIFGGAPTAPSGLAAVQGATPEDEIDLSWTNEDTYDHVEVWRDGSKVATISGGATSYTDGSGTGDLDDGTEYCYQVKGCTTADGCSGFSNQDCATTDLPDPSSLTATAGDGEVSLAWTNGSTEYDNVEVERKPSGGSYSMLTTLIGSATSHTDATAVNGTTYFYRMRGTTADANSGYSNEDSATPTAPVDECVRPSADVSTGTFDDSDGGDGDGALWDELGGTSPNDSSFVRSGQCTNPSDGTAQTCTDENFEVRLPTGSDHTNDQTIIVRVRNRMTVLSTGSYDLTVEVYTSGGTLIGSDNSNNRSNTSFRTTSFSLNPSGVSNFQNLRVKLIADLTTGTGLGDSIEIDVSWVELCIES